SLLFQKQVDGNGVPRRNWAAACTRPDLRRWRSDVTSKPVRSEKDQSLLTFLIGAVLILAHQVAGKAARDGLFLSRFSPADLPKIISVAAVFAALLGLAFSRLLVRFGPMRLVPMAFAFGAVLHVLEYLFLQRAGNATSGFLITIVYVHLVGFGAILL